MSERKSMTNPTIFINGYLAEKVPEYLEEYGLLGQFNIQAPNYFDGVMKFFPVSPTNIEELTSQFPTSAEAPFAVYDRMLRFRRGPFPHIKKEQLIYYFYKMTSSNNPSSNMPGVEILIETVQAVEDLLNRGDESAEELNSWIQSKLNSDGLYQPVLGIKGFDPVYFHDVQVFHLEEVRDIIDFGTARTYAGNKLILDYCYHAPDFKPSPQKFIPIPEEQS